MRAHLSVQTILCRDCKQLYDAVTRIRILTAPVHVALHGMLAGINAGKEFNVRPASIGLSTVLTLRGGTDFRMANVPLAMSHFLQATESGIGTIRIMPALRHLP